LHRVHVAPVHLKALPVGCSQKVQDNKACSRSI
jgi:hypothetical protein